MECLSLAYSSRYEPPVFKSSLSTQGFSVGPPGNGPDGPNSLDSGFAVREPPESRCLLADVLPLPLDLLPDAGLSSAPMFGGAGANVTTPPLSSAEDMAN